MIWQGIKDFLIDNTVLLGSFAAVVVIAGAVGAFFLTPLRRLFARKKPSENINLTPIMDLLTEEARRHGAAASKLEGAAQREEDLQEQIRQLTAAVEALSAKQGDSDAPLGIGEALRLIKVGNMAAAEAVFETDKARRKAESEGALKEAAAAARHIGALAFLHDTDKALAAYREAVALDPENPEGWNQFGHLLKRASDLDRAEEMYRKSLEIDEALGRKKSMAAATGNLGILYQTRGELDRAEAMYRKSLELFREIGAVPQIEQVEGWLAKLRKSE